MTAFMNVELSLLTIKLICSVFITLVAALGVMIPYWSRKEAEETTTDRYAFGVCLCAGVLLSGALVHLLPDAIESIGTYSATCLAGGCVMFLLIIGEMATYLLPDRGAGHFPSARMTTFDEFVRKTASRQDIFESIEEGTEPDARYYLHVGTEEAAVCMDGSNCGTLMSENLNTSKGNLSGRVTGGSVTTPSRADEFRIRLGNTDPTQQRERLLRVTEQEYIKNETGGNDDGGGMSWGGTHHGSSYLPPPPIFVPPPARPSLEDKARNTGGSEDPKSRSRFSDVKARASFYEKARQQSAISLLNKSGEGNLAHNEHPHNISMEIRSYVLFLALSFHSIMEGLGIGSAQTEGVVGPIFVAIIAHKGLTGFALGNTLIRAQVVKRAFLFMVLTFSLCTPVGVFAGIYVADQGSIASGVGIALASGTFLQVSMLEITARQMAEEQFKFAKVAGLCIGFGAMSFLGLYV